MIAEKHNRFPRHPTNKFPQTTSSNSYNHHPPTDTLTFQRTLTFYPQAFFSMKAARQFLDAIQSGKQKVEKQPGEMFAARHLPNHQFIIQQLILCIL